MKTLLFACIVFCFGLIGYMVKMKYKNQKEFLVHIKSFINFLELNISVYKNNINEIINIYLNQQNIKNAKIDKFFRKNDILSCFDEKIINSEIYDKDLRNYLLLYFSGLGKGDKDSEINNAKNIKGIIDFYINKTNDEIKTKGDLYFKLLLFLGLTICLILW